MKLFFLKYYDYSHQMPSYVLGIIKFEQMPIGVIDLREVFKKDRVIYDLSAKIIVLKAGENYTSIICDKVYDIKKLNPSNIKEIPYQQEANFFEGLYSKDDDHLFNCGDDIVIFKSNKKSQQQISCDQSFRLNNI